MSSDQFPASNDGITQGRPISNNPSPPDACDLCSKNPIIGLILLEYGATSWLCIEHFNHYVKDAHDRAKLFGEANP